MAACHKVPVKEQWVWRGSPAGILICVCCFGRHCPAAGRRRLAASLRSRAGRPAVVRLAGRLAPWAHGPMDPLARGPKGPKGPTVPINPQGAPRSQLQPPIPGNRFVSAGGHMSFSKRAHKQHCTAVCFSPRPQTPHPQTNIAKHPVCNYF